MESMGGVDWWLVVLGSSPEWREIGNVKEADQLKCGIERCTDVHESRTSVRARPGRGGYPEVRFLDKM